MNKYDSKQQKKLATIGGCSQIGWAKREGYELELSYKMSFKKK